MVTLRIVLCKARQRVLIGLLGVACAGFLLVGCGYKGPLYLPPPPDTLGETSEQPDPRANDALEKATESSIQTNPSLEPAPIVIQ